MRRTETGANQTEIQSMSGQMVKALKALLILDFESCMSLRYTLQGFVL